MKNTTQHTSLYLKYLVPLALIPLFVVVALPSMSFTSDQMSDDIRIPRAGLAMYQPRTGDLLLGFDVPARLAEDWYVSIGIRALSGSEPIILDKLDGARNVMEHDGSCIIMVQLGHADRIALLDATTMRVVMEPGAVTGPGDRANHHTMLPVEIIQ